MKHLVFLTVFLMLAIGGLFANLPPVVTNPSAAQRTDGSKIVDITYDVQDAESDSLTIVLTVSDDSGQTWDITPTTDNLSGDVGSGITPGVSRHIVWQAGAEGIAFDAGTYRVKITAWDSDPVPDGFVLVPAGNCRMGDTHGVCYDGDETPIHLVNLDSFYIGKYELTQQEWVDVMGSNPSHFTGNMQLPVEKVSWYDVVKYCNYRSIQEDRTPVYSVSGDTDPDNWGATFEPDVDWTASSYRLPTEAEWEYSARGATNDPDYLYAGSNTVGDVAWYNGNTGAYTHYVGQKQSNGLGLYDISGNVWEWCWDWYYDQFYLECSQDGSSLNPENSASNTNRVRRGGNWYYDEYSCRVTNRSYYEPALNGNGIGFRLAMTAPGYGENSAPIQPENPSPETGATNVQPTTTLSWQCSDPDGDDLTYDIYMGTASGVYPDSLVASSLTDTTYTPAGLHEGTTYYWKVIASDGAWINESEEWSFTVMNLPDMVYVPAGSFQMGRVGVAEPVHTVTLDAFYIGKYEVTQQEYLSVMGTNPSYFANSGRPVEQVSWYDAVAFCNALSLEAGYDPCYIIAGENTICDFTASGYRLPTEAEWEYAARGATNDPDYIYAGSDTIGDVAWYDGNSGSQTHPVGEKDFNGIGTHDQTGNVYEWCWDWYGPYSEVLENNPTGSESGTLRIKRGGAYSSNPSLHYVSKRTYQAPDTIYCNLGLRVVRNAE